MNERLRHPVYALTAVFFLLNLAQKGSKVLVALTALELGANAFTVGCLAATYALFPLLLSVYSGRISDRIGAAKPILWGAMGIAAALTLPALHLNLLTLILCPALLGLGHIFAHVSIHNAIGFVSSSERRSRSYATLSLGSSAAAFCGPLIVGLTIDTAGNRAGFLFTAICAVLIAVPLLLAWRHLDVPAKSKTEGTGGRTLDLLALPDLRRTMLMSGVAVTGIELFSFYLPIYGKSIDLSATVIGTILSAYAIAAVLVRLGMSLLLRRTGAVTVLTTSLFVASLSYALIPLVTNAWVLFAIAFLLGLGLGLAGPLTIYMTYNGAPPGRSGEALGLRISANKVIQICIPLIFGGIGTAFGASPVFLANSALLLVGGVLSTLGIRGRRAGGGPSQME
ncbi:MFS transporter [Chelativorans alearense]|uniref:MFS transporter n=1 Tax=Chelativorans alearense TaxID=2681495 RepID=UPI0013CFD733|nr:MFS transporter [Chelativorans alearense]